MFCQKNNKILIANYTFLVSNKYVYYINIRYLQRQTFKSNEKIKKVKSIHNFEKAQNIKIKPPSIFALPMSYDFENVIDVTGNMFYSLLHNEHVKYSYDLFNELIEHLRNIQATQKKELYVKSAMNPLQIKKLYSILLPQDSDYKLVIDIVNKYNINVFFQPNALEGEDFTYLSEEGAYVVDKFLQTKVTNFESNDFKMLSFSEKFFKDEISYITKLLIEKKTMLKKMKISTNSKLLLMVYNTLLRLDQGHLRIFIRCLTTLLFKEGDINSETEEQKLITTNEGKTFYKLYTSYGGLIIRFGDMFLKSYHRELSTKELNSDIVTIFTKIKNHINKLEEERERFKIAMTKLEETSKISLKDIKIIEKNIIEFLDKQKTLPLDHNILMSLINFYNNFKDLNIKDLHFNVVKHYTLQQIPKILSIIGEALLELFSNVLFINKEDDSSIYIDNEFYWTTKQSGKYPFFGIKQVTIKDLENNIDADKNKFIYTSLSYAYYQPMMNYSSKYYLNSANSNFTDQLQDSSNLYVCKLNIGIFTNFLNAISYFIDRKEQINEDFLRYLLPKETNLKNIIREFDKYKQTEQVIGFMCDLSKLSYKDFTRETKITDLKPLILANISYKFEIIQLLRILWPLTLFYCWYPRIWADARGRQYPYEMPLNITKSPKWRSLFQYVTYQDNAENTKDYLINQKDMLNIQDNKLSLRIELLEENLKKVFKKHHGRTI